MAEALDIRALLTEGVVCLVAASREGIVGSAFALVAGALGVIGRIAVADPARVTDPLLDRLEATLLEQGARKLICWPQAGDPVDQLAARGYEQVEGAALVGRTLPPTVTGPSAVERLGGRIRPAPARPPSRRASPHACNGRSSKSTRPSSEGTARSSRSKRWRTSSSSSSTWPRPSCSSTRWRTSPPFGKGST